MSGAPGQVVYGGDEIDLRAAEEVDSTGATLIQSNLAAGNQLLNALQITAPDAIEILAIEYWISLSMADAAQEPVPALTTREGRTQLFLVTAEEDFGAAAGFARDLEEGDYFQGHVHCMPSVAFEDPTNGTGGVGGGQLGTAYVLMDPGKDAETGPLVLREGEQVNVHLQLAAAIGANAELKTTHRLSVYFAEVEEELTNVREQFPSRGSGPSV